MVKWCDFTFIDDIVEAISRLAVKEATFEKDFDQLNPDAGTSDVPWRILILAIGINRINGLYLCFGNRSQ